MTMNRIDNIHDIDLNPKRRYTIAIDFDKTLHLYSKGWNGGEIYDVPIEGAKEAIQELDKQYELIIFTCRPFPKNVEAWIMEHFDVWIPVTNSKPHADMYIDDRGYHFTGDWTDTLIEVARREKGRFKG